MKITKEEFKQYDFYVVPVGFQPMGTNQYLFTETVTEESAVKVDSKIFCTETWLKKIEEKFK